MKGLGGWGLKNIFIFAKSLAAKGGWRLLKAKSLWTQVMTQKYIGPGSVEDWFRDLVKLHVGGLIFWKTIVKSLDVIEANISWQVGNGRHICVGEDLWVGCIQQHIL